MFNADPKIIARIAPHMQRVVIFDPQPAAGKLVTDLVKSMGVRQSTIASKTVKGLELIAHLDPQLIFIEYQADDFDGPDLIKRLRRSALPCRKAPAIMVTGVATVESIKAARDSGVHEFLRKPFTAKDMFRRVENVCLNPRLWIEAQMYVGPDRRRFNSGEFTGSKKRRADAGAAPAPAQAPVTPIVVAVA